MTKTKPTILVIGTLDTKLLEIVFLQTQISAASDGACQTKVLDVGRNCKNASAYPHFQASDLVLPLLDIADDLQSLQRGDYVNKAIEKCMPVVSKLIEDSEIHGIVSAGGSTGSSLAAAIMRDACPIGFPKLMVSTMASGDIKPYIEETDIAMMYSVVDIAGINSLLGQILSNAAGAIVGMTSAYVLQRKKDQEISNAGGKKIAITMFGVTTPCVDMIRNMLTSTPHDVSGHEIFVFHATGSGGRAMERLINEGRIDAVIDLTTTEIPDELMGGVLSAGNERLEAAVRKGIPMVVSVGACDMVNFGPKDSVPEKYAERKLYVHNPAVTLMRTTSAENTKIGTFISSKLKAAIDQSLIRVVLPAGGLSMLDKEGQPFFDPEADEALFESIKSGLQDTKIEVQTLAHNINTEEFAREICENILELLGINPRNYRLANARRRQWSFGHGASIEAVRRASLVNIPDVRE